MQRELTCIACPQGCRLTVDIDEGRVIAVSGNKCPKGLEYGRQEIENPLRTLTTTVGAAGLNLQRVPVRTRRPIPKTKIAEAMQALRAVRLERPVRCGDVVVADLLGLGVEVVATRSVSQGA